MFSDMHFHALSSLFCLIASKSSLIVQTSSRFYLHLHLHYIYLIKYKKGNRFIWLLSPMNLRVMGYLSGTIIFVIFSHSAITEVKI